MSLVGKEGPDFVAKAVEGEKVLENFQLSDQRGHYVILFFYPLDFTFVCPTELISFQEKLSEFQKRDCKVIGCSIDSHFSHLAWLSTPREKGGIKGVQYPIVADLTKEISRDYGVLKEDEGIAYRGLFLFDKKGVVRHELINDLPLGRNVDEALRMVDALQFTEEHGEVCPASWAPGKKSMKPDQKGLKDYFNS